MRSYALVIIAIGFFSLGVSCSHTLEGWQVEDNPDRLHFRAGHFATPIKIIGDEQTRDITSMEIIAELNGDVNSGQFLVHEGKLSFNQFGDAESVGQDVVTEYSIVLKQVDPKIEPTFKQDNGFEGFEPRRIVYEIVFEEAFCDHRFYLNLPLDCSNIPRLIQCPGEPPPKSSFSLEPTIDELWVLNNLAAVSEEPADEPVGFASFMSTQSIKSESGNRTAGIKIAVNLNGQSTLEHDVNSVGLSDYGDSGMQTLMACFASNVELVEQSINDPLGLNRRLFNVTGTTRAHGRDTDADKWNYSVVLSPTMAGHHRLIVTQENLVTHVLPLTDNQWRTYSRMLSTIADDRELNAIKAVRAICGNQFRLSVKDGHAFSIRLYQSANDAALTQLTELDQLEHLFISQCRSITDVGLQSIGELAGLKSLNISHSLTTDNLLQNISHLQLLESLTINHYTDDSGSEHSDEGVMHLENLTNLKVLRLEGRKLTNQSLISISKLPKLEELNLVRTGITPVGIVDICRVLPGCRLSSTHGSGESNYQIRIEESGMRVIITGELAEQDYEHLDSIMTLEHLSLPDSATDATLETISQIGTLKRLTLNHCQTISSKGVAHLMALQDLEILNLRNCQRLDDECVPYLSSMTGLKELWVGSTKISESGLDRLHAELPDCEFKK